MVLYLIYLSIFRDWTKAILDLSGRLALSLFCKISFDVDTRMLREDTACLQDHDVFIDCVTELNEISAG